MKKMIEQVIKRFRRDNPRVGGWTDEQVLDAMFRLAAQQCPSRITKVGERSDGTAIFRIALTSDGSDGL